MAVDVEVVEWATLGEVIDSAARAFGVTAPSNAPVSQAVDCVSFYRPSDSRHGSYDYSRWQRAIRLVDAVGNPSWGVRWSEIRMDELRVSAAHDLVDGDPLRPYLWPVIPQGDAVAELSAAAWTIWMLWEHALTVRETAGLAREALRRVMAGQKAAHEEPASWAAALRRPDDLMAFLRSRPRTTSEVAAKTGLTRERAEGALWGLGFTAREDGRWVPAGDRIASALHEAVMSVEARGRPPDELEVEITVRALFRD